MYRDGFLRCRLGRRGRSVEEFEPWGSPTRSSESERGKVSRFSVVGMLVDVSIPLREALHWGWAHQPIVVKVPARWLVEVALTVELQKNMEVGRNYVDAWTMC